MQKLNGFSLAKVKQICVYLLTMTGEVVSICIRSLGAIHKSVINHFDQCSHSLDWIAVRGLLQAGLFF
jgi:hypothetical protein